MMKCRCSKSDHWTKDGMLYLNSPMYHCEDKCPHESGDCISHCSRLVAHQRPCLAKDFDKRITVVKEDRRKEKWAYVIS